MNQTSVLEGIPKEGGLALPAYSHLSDEALMKGSANDFMKLLYHRAKQVGDDLYEASGYEFTTLSPEDHRENLILYMRRRAWSEWFFGTVSPARQITLLPEDQVELKLRLAKQIRDEMRHYDVFAAQLKRFGAEPRIAEFELPPILIRMQRVQLEAESAPEIAATNQFAGEIVLTSMTDLKDSIFIRLFDEELMNAIRDIETDEPPHVANGRDLILLGSKTASERRKLAQAQEHYLEAMMELHVTEIVKMGCRRVKPLPFFI